jgi:hypothetical protein
LRACQQARKNACEAAAVMARSDAGKGEAGAAKGATLVLDLFDETVAKRMNNCAASHHGPSSAGMPRHFAPFW